jgi:hypothetical protein
MTKANHTNGELKPAAAALRALTTWLEANGLRRAALAPVLKTHQVQLHRVFAGTGYLSATQRRAIEEFTAGAVTAAMLEGKAAPPARIEPKPRQAPEAVVAAPAVAVAPVGAKPQTTEEAERVVDELAARAMPAAFKLVVQQMVQAKSESERRRCAEILIEQFRGKAKQYERRDKSEPPATDTELIEVFQRIEANLGGSNATRPVPPVPGGAPGDAAGGAEPA